MASSRLWFNPQKMYSIVLVTSAHLLWILEWHEISQYCSQVDFILQRKGINVHTQSSQNYLSGMKSHSRHFSPIKFCLETCLIALYFSLWIRFKDSLSLHADENVRWLTFTTVPRIQWHLIPPLANAQYSTNLGGQGDWRKEL